MSYNLFKEHLSNLIGRSGEKGYEEIWRMALTDLVDHPALKLKAIMFLVEQLNGKARQQIEFHETHDPARELVARMSPEVRLSLAQAIDAGLTRQNN